MAARHPRMLQLVTAAMSAKDRRARKDPARRLKSYLLQEAEATSREAKIRWCVANGKKVFGLQHDGIVVQSGDDASEETAMAAAMEVAATKEAGYSVKIKAERCRNLCVD